MGLKKTLPFLVIAAFSFLLGYIVRGTSAVETVNKENELRSFYDQLTQNEISKDLSKQYEVFEHPALHDFISKERFIDIFSRNSQRDYLTPKYEVNSVKVVGNLGLVDRTYRVCSTEECKPGDDLITQRLVKPYIYSDGKWHTLSLVTQAETLALPLRYPQLCNRMSPYPIAPEFKRAISLIQQRSLNVEQLPYGDAKEIMRFSSKIDQIYNCLNIKYALNESDMGGAEGIFLFSTTSTPDQLNILVSPEYESRDDLLTSLLLIHELSHAYDYSYETMKLSVGDTSLPDCYQDEAYAFTNEYTYYLTLNDEERSSLYTRYITSNPSVANFFSELDTISSLPGQYYFDKALNYVKSHPDYQEQCRQN